MKKIILAGVIGLMASVSAQAEYQASFDLGYIDTDFDSGFLIGGTYYLESVNDSNGPLSEAAFIDKSSNVSAGFASVGDEDVIVLSGRHVFERDYTVSASYADIDSDSVISLGVGKYLTDTSEVILTYASSDFTDSLGVDYHQLQELSGAGSLSYDVGVAYVDSDFGFGSESGYGVNGAFTYYPSDEFSFGVFGDLIEIDGFDTTTIGINAEYFFDRNLALSAEISKVDLGPVDNDTLSVTFEARF